MKTTIMILVVIIGILSYFLFTKEENTVNIANNPNFTDLSVSNRLINTLNHLWETEKIKMVSIDINGEKTGGKKIILNAMSTTDDGLEVFVVKPLHFQSTEPIEEKETDAEIETQIYRNQFNLFPLAHAATCNVTESIPYPSINNCIFIGWKYGGVENGAQSSTHCHCW